MGKLVALRPAADQQLSDIALIAAIATGDAAALATLYGRYHVAVYRFVARLAGVDARDLDDLVQQTFLAVHSAAARFQERASVKTWIFGIAAHVVGKHVRSEVRRRALGSRFATVAPIASATPAATAERRQLLYRLEQALEGLPHDLRAVFVLCVIEEVPGKEAACVLGIREGTLWRRLYDARTRLRDAVEGSP